ncbi:major capsid protein [Dipodfec virus UA06Rod_17]|uniref:Major capsid protein n=1 Tax=Dipodfec virus UA06Rod_17 TaxID=2929318 RepID=A0A976N1Y9_9VIRU|nr:major capsid protein [Dipodfec virus UA06Rod_17]
MANKYNQNVASDTSLHFSQAAFGEVEHSRMTVRSQHLTTFNAGDIVPIYCQEILPDESLSLDVNSVIRQSTLLTPTMGKMTLDLFAFFVPNRVVNQSWKAVQGENYSGSWTANPVELAPLYTGSSAVQVPVGSVADYYGFPTQSAISANVLSQCHDLKFRGYVMIYNEYFRDQNYQPPIPFSTLNVYNDFFRDPSSDSPVLVASNITATTVPDGGVGSGAVVNAILGSGQLNSLSSFGSVYTNWQGRFSALSAPLKANKLHDYFTSVLPSPQRGSPILVSITGSVSHLPVSASTSSHITNGSPLIFDAPSGSSAPYVNIVGSYVSGSSSPRYEVGGVTGSGSSPLNLKLVPSNLWATGELPAGQLGFDISDLRQASAIQQVYETLARGGSRYRSILSSFFGLDVDDPFSDIPVCLGKRRIDLDLFQTAQTSPSETGSTPQGNLAAFGYTSEFGKLFDRHFVEHGYVHVFAVVRHKNVYSSYLGRDNFRRSMLDFYTPPMANISEQPVYRREINPFSSSPDSAFGYQEAWAEYRFEPDRVSGYMRPGINGSLSIWNYADDFDSGLQIADGAWLKSNSQQVLDRTLAVTSAVAPQLKGQFDFVIDKTLPMPTYSVPGMDII